MQPVTFVIILVTCQTMLYRVKCHKDYQDYDYYEDPTSGNDTDTVKVQKHISSLISSTKPTNYTGACDEAPDLFNCFNDWDKHTVYLYLFSHGRNGSEILKLGDTNQLTMSTFNKSGPTKIIIHGFKMTAFSHFSHLLREAYLEHRNDTNVIVVDWRWLAGDHLYLNSAFNTRIVGERVGEFIVYMKETGFIKSYKSVHIIGFSLGAHVAGFAGKHVRKTVKKKIGRITGLDPAGPSFNGGKPKKRLDVKDARFVDIIHTCVGYSGITESIGHVDFFPNGGVNQPGCDWDIVRSFWLRNCSHERSFQFFLASIRGERFIGCPCSNWDDFTSGNCRCNMASPGAAIMGEECSVEARGNKYLATTYDSHYISL